MIFQQNMSVSLGNIALLINVLINVSVGNTALVTNVSINIFTFCVFNLTQYFGIVLFPFAFAFLLSAY